MRDPTTNRRAPTQVRDTRGLIMTDAEHRRQRLYDFGVGFGVGFLVATAACGVVLLAYFVGAF